MNIKGRRIALTSPPGGVRLKGHRREPVAVVQVAGGAHNPTVHVQIVERPIKKASALGKVG